MKTFQQLTVNQQDLAVSKCLNELLAAVLEGAIHFDNATNQDDLQRRIDTAIAQANKMHTPWFAHEYVLDTCREELEGLARCRAEDALYPEADEYVITGIAA